MMAASTARPDTSGTNEAPLASGWARRTGEAAAEEARRPRRSGRSIAERRAPGAAAVGVGRTPHWPPVRFWQPFLDVRAPSHGSNSARIRVRRIARVRLPQPSAQSPRPITMWLNELASPDSYTGFSVGVVSTLSPRDARALGRRLASHSPLRPRPATARQQSPGRCLCFKAPEVSGAWQRGGSLRAQDVGGHAPLPPSPRALLTRPLHRRRLERVAAGELARRLS